MYREKVDTEDKKLCPNYITLPTSKMIKILFIVMNVLIIEVISHIEMVHKCTDKWWTKSENINGFFLNHNRINFKKRAKIFGLVPHNTGTTTNYNSGS